MQNDEKVEPRPEWFWQKNFREGMLIPLSGFEFRVSYMEGNEMLLEVKGPTRALQKQIDKDKKAAKHKFKGSRQ